MHTQEFNIRGHVFLRLEEQRYSPPIDCTTALCKIASDCIVQAGPKLTSLSSQSLKHSRLRHCRRVSSCPAEALNKLASLLFVFTLLREGTQGCAFAGHALGHLVTHLALGQMFLKTTNHVQSCLGWRLIKRVTTSFYIQGHARSVPWQSSPDKSSCSLLKEGKTDAQTNSITKAFWTQEKKMSMLCF